MMPEDFNGSGARLVSLRPKAWVAAILSIACVLSLGIDLPATAAIPAVPAKDKKPKQDPSLKGLPITELSLDEAILMP